MELQRFEHNGGYVYKLVKDGVDILDFDHYSSVFYNNILSFIENEKIGFSIDYLPCFMEIIPKVACNATECVVEVNPDDRLSRATYLLRGKNLPQKKIVIYGKSTSWDNVIVLSHVWSGLKKKLVEGYFMYWSGNESLKSYGDDCVLIGLSPYFRRKFIHGEDDVKRLIISLFGGEIHEN